MRTRFLLPILVIATMAGSAWPIFAQTAAKPAAPVNGFNAPTGKPLGPDVAKALPDKDGRILVRGFTVVGGEPSAAITLLSPEPAYNAGDLEANPALRDTVKVVLSPRVVQQLHDLGIDEPISHFFGRTLQVRGVKQETLYFCYPAFAAVTITVDRLEDIKVMAKSSSETTSPSAPTTTYLGGHP